MATIRRTDTTQYSLFYKHIKTALDRTLRDR